MSHGKEIKSEQGLKMLAKIRSICKELPEVKEQVDKFGHTTFRVNDKPIVFLGENEEGAGLSFKTDRETQGMLIQQERFFKTPYIGQHGWVSLQMGASLDEDELKQFIVEACLRTAPKRLVNQYRS